SLWPPPVTHSAPPSACKQARATGGGAWLRLQTGKMPTRRLHMKNLLLLAAIVLIAAPMAARAQSVKVAYDHTADFTKFTTYSWIKGKPAGNPQVHKLIVDEIDRRLQSKGLKKV